MNNELKPKKSKDFNYYSAFVEACDLACESAEVLKTAVRDLANLETYKTKVHELENRADKIYHSLVNALSRAFITPLESEDLKLLGQAIDNVIDVIEDVASNFYILNITDMRPEAIEFTDLIFDCCKSMQLVMTEFANFRKSKKIDQCIIDVNHMEEKGDHLYHAAIRRLFTEPGDAIEIIKWRRIFELMEKCCDSCEDVADTVESVILKNT